MATEAECDAALRTLVDLLAALEADVRAKYVLDRRVSCRVPDLGLTWSAHLTVDGLRGLHNGDEPKAQIRVTVGSDDLVALVEGRQPFPSAFATGRLRVQAGPFDMLRLTALLSLGA